MDATGEERADGVRGYVVDRRANAGLVSLYRQRRDIPSGVLGHRGGTVRAAPSVVDMEIQGFVGIAVSIGNDIVTADGRNDGHSGRQARKIDVLDFLDHDLVIGARRILFRHDGTVEAPDGIGVSPDVVQRVGRIADGAAAGTAVLARVVVRRVPIHLDGNPRVKEEARDLELSGRIRVQIGRRWHGTPVVRGARRRKEHGLFLRGLPVLSVPDPTSLLHVPDGRRPPVVADDLRHGDGHAADGAVVRDGVVVVVGRNSGAALAPAHVHDPRHADVADTGTGHGDIACPCATVAAGKPLRPLVLRRGNGLRPNAPASCRDIGGPRGLVGGHVVAEDSPERVFVVLHDIARPVGDEDERIVLRVAGGDDEAAIRELDHAKRPRAIRRRQRTNLADAPFQLRIHCAADGNKARGGCGGFIVRHRHGKRRYGQQRRQCDDCPAEDMAFHGKKILFRDSPTVG